MSISLSESAATSSERESERQESLTTQAVHTLVRGAEPPAAWTRSTAVNAYVGAFNNGGSDAAAAKEGPAIDALNHSADLVAGSLRTALSPELQDALTAWVDAARAVAERDRGHASAR